MSVFSRGFDRVQPIRIAIVAICLFFGFANGVASAADDPRCAPAVRSGISAMVQRSNAMAPDIRRNSWGPPPSVQQAMNIPCKYNELQRISNQFAYAPTGAGSSVLGQLNSLAGPASGLLNNYFKADITAFGSMMKSAGGLSLDFGGFVQGQLNTLLGSLGLGNSPFAGALCGMMVDTLLKYIQCESPIKLPQLGSLTGSLNNLLPKGCAGEAVRGALYAAGSTQEFKPMNQGIISGQGGLFSNKPLTFGPVPTQ